ncbi:iron chelate uptake ABC transporter family permease subunit, partial [Massilia solisilvae]
MPTQRASERARRQRMVLALLAACAVASLALAGIAGSAALPLSELPAALLGVVTGKVEGMAASLLDLRLGRASSAFATGAALSLAGVMMQALVRNPLADPYVLGISSGAAVGALGALFVGAALWAVDLG